MTPLRYSDLSPADIAAIRILAALEITYPETVNGDSRRPSTVLAGWTAWKAKRAA